jgi:hypothetical protein
VCVNNLFWKYLEYVKNMSLFHVLLKIYKEWPLLEEHQCRTNNVVPQNYINMALNVTKTTQCNYQMELLKIAK